MGVRDNTTARTQTVERALSILTCFTDARPRLRVSDLVKQLALLQSTASRLLATLESLGFVERDPQTGRYSLGLELVTLAGIALNQIEVRWQAMAELLAVAAELGLAVNLAILRGDEIFYLATVEGPKAPRFFTMIGKRNQLHCTGMGKALLAHLPYPVFTTHTADSAEALRPMLARVIERDYAVEREELAFGRACVAAAIRDATGAVIAATSISGPLSAIDLEHREGQLAARVIEMADHISHSLGYITVSSPPPALRRAALRRSVGAAEFSLHAPLSCSPTGEDR